ncbi:hypothetical protein B0A63_24980 [Flavobacterium johnsoniae UW101]|nr:hypothetical protein B0A63_24980 [Flavobacterium johnsoniae UW101]
MLAECKGVHREVESEGSSRQTLGLTNRNYIQGQKCWIRLLYKPKSQTVREHYGKYSRQMRGKLSFLTWGGLIDIGKFFFTELWITTAIRSQQRS